MQGGGGATSRTNLQVHFVHHHVWDTIVNLEEGNRPHPCCPNCDIFVPWAALNHRHSTIALCAMAAERKYKRLTEEEALECYVLSFKVYKQPLVMVSSFKYTGWMLTAMDDDWPAIVGNLRKARKVSDRLS